MSRSELSLEERAERLRREQHQAFADSAEVRLAFLAEASALLDGSLDYEVTIARVARLAFPWFADCCRVDLADERGDLGCIATAHVVPDKDALLQQRVGVPPAEGSMRMRVFTTGEPLLVPDVSPAYVASLDVDQRTRRAMDEIGSRSAIIVPLQAGGRTLGVITFIVTESDRRYTEADLAFARQLASRAAAAIDNARLHDRERRARAAAEQAAQRLARLQVVTAALSGALTPLHVARVVTTEAAEALAARDGVFGMVCDGGANVEMVATCGLPASFEGIRYPASVSFPLADALRTGTPVILRSPEEIRARYPHYEQLAPMPRGLAAMPLSLDGRTLGAFQFCFAHDGHPCDVDRDFLFTLAQVAAQALERARLFAAAAESEARFHAFVDLIPQQAWITQPGQRPEYLNQRTLDYLGLTREQAGELVESDLIGRFIHPDDQQRGIAAWAAAAQQQTVLEAEERLLGADGVYRWQLIRAAPVPSGDGKVIKWFGTATDIDRQKQVEAALRRSEARFRRVWETSVLGLVFFSTDGRILAANDAAAAITGHSRADYEAGRVRAQDSTPEEFRARAGEALAELRRTGVCTPYEKEILRPDGVRVPVLVAAALFDEPAGEGVGFMVNLRERKRAEREKAELIEREHAFRERLMGIVGHDLRTPLAAIVVAAGLLRDGGSLSPADLRVVERIAGSGLRMARMVADLADFTRSRQVGGIAIQRAPIDLSVACRDAVDELATAHADRRIDIELSGDGRGEWDRDRLVQVVTNLVTNALDHGDPAAGVRVQVLGDDAAAVRLEVHNLGEPIAAEDLPFLFDPFRRARRPRERASRHLGLGLYIVHEIVRAHGGSIEVRSTVEEGTRFVVRLPRG